MKTLVKPMRINDNDKIQKEEMTISLERRLELAAKDITINGKPARLYGIQNRFAVVWANDNGLKAEWSWEAVERIVTEKNGEFKK